MVFLNSYQQKPFQAENKHRGTMQDQNWLTLYIHADLPMVFSTAHHFRD